MLQSVPRPKLSKTSRELARQCVMWRAIRAREFLTTPKHITIGLSILRHGRTIHACFDCRDQRAAKGSRLDQRESRQGSRCLSIARVRYQSGRGVSWFGCGAVGFASALADALRVAGLGLRKAGEKFDDYLKKQEDLISRGELDEAAQQRAEFERKIVKYVGAPLLGAFSCAAGAAMWAQIFQPGAITGAPISWLLGGNPFLDGVWLFANGVICFHQGYKFFMIALANQEEVVRVVREIKGLLPAAAI